MTVPVSTETDRLGRLSTQLAAGSSSWPELEAATRRSQDYLLSIQKPEGFWVGELMVDSTLVSDTVAYHHWNGKVDPHWQRKAVNHLLAMQLPDGGWPPSANVKVSGWGTALCVTLAIARNEWDTPLRKGVEWLVGASGAETNWMAIVASRIGLVDYGRNVALKAWPWRPGNSAWVEPTVHAVVALKIASAIRC